MVALAVGNKLLTTSKVDESKSFSPFVIISSPSSGLNLPGAFSLG